MQRNSSFWKHVELALSIWLSLIYKRVLIAFAVTWLIAKLFAKEFGSNLASSRFTLVFESNAFNRILKATNLKGA